jgi:alkylation response protein AidB-like acyl-CoA dehydrogenase
MKQTIRSAVDQINALTSPGRVVQADAWAEMAKQGWLGAGLPRDAGGLGGSLADVAGLAEELGAAALCSPFSSMASAVLALSRKASQEAADLYPLVSQGTLQVAPLWPAVAGGGSLTARSSGNVWRVSGELGLVEFADTPTHFLVAAEVSGGHGEAVFMVSASNTVLNSAHLGPSMSGAPVSRMTIDGQAPEPMMEGPRASALKGDAERLLRLFTCFELAGLGRKLVQMSAEYARNRQQFGRPIGSFQAVQHLIADMHIEVELAFLAAEKFLEATAADEEQEAHWDGTACSLASAAYTRCALDAHEVFAGVGFIKEHDLHLFTRRAISLTSRLPAARETNRRLALSALQG